MEDQKIVELYWQRDNNAIQETKNKYGNFLFKIAQNILKNKQDAEECENDTYLAAWDAMPPNKPQWLSAFLGKITRNLSFKKLRAANTQKRGKNNTPFPLDELYDTISISHAFEKDIEASELADALNSFLDSLKIDERRIFICRYWYCDSISDIAQQFGFSQSKVKMTLLRIRQKLLEHLNKEEIYI